MITPGKIAIKLQESWDFMRVIRIILAFFVIYEGIKSDNYFMFALAAIFLYQAVMNVKCLPCELSGSCTIEDHKPGNSEVKGKAE